MSNWITFQDLLNRWEIEKFEVVEYLKKGLQPYTKGSGKPLVCPPFCHLEPIDERIIKTGSEILSEAENFGRELNRYEKLSVALKEEAEKELEVIKKDDPGFVSWKWLAQFADDAEYSDDEFKKLFLYLNEAIFKLEDVLVFDEKYKQKPREENLDANYQKVFTCKTGTKWEDVKITLIENEAVRIETPQGGTRSVDTKRIETIA